MRRLCVATELTRAKRARATWCYRRWPPLDLRVRNSFSTREFKFSSILGALRAQQFKSVLSAEDMALLRVWTGRVKQVTNTNASTQISTSQQVRRTKADL